MIRIKESIAQPNGIENWLNIPNTKGNKGMDVLKKNGIVFVHGNEKADIGISKHGQKVNGVPKKHCILFKGEPPIYNIFWGMRNCNKKNLLRYMAVLSSCVLDGIEQTHYIIPQAAFQHADKYFDKDKTEFLCMVLKNKRFTVTLNSLVPGNRKYTKRSNMQLRIKADNEFSSLLGPEKYHSYGRGWNRKCFKGSLPDKKALYETISKYKFNFCPENSRFNGYITEKPVQAMCLGSIPVYVGPPDVDKYLPTGTYIDYRKFTAPELVDYLKNMDEREYNNYRKRIKKFITSKKADVFSSVTFAHKIVDIIEKK
ncbi:Glycosyltransferase family 10 (fucosyltransferase) [Thermoplasmatales archaeon SCGC AB-539-N05]|nr:Glycosyltransferase family 10 (fucosyltransferase) [Thermoplasmatales archaeon SCGC AB-539-N05]